MASNRPYQIGPDTVAHFTYRLFDEEGELVEDSGDAAFSFLFGYAQLVPTLERALEGMLPGASKRILLRPEEAFGRREADKIIEVDRAEFPADLSEGDEFQADSEDGSEVTLVVLEADDERVVLDANHPLAGQTVALAVEVQAVRPALAEEIAEASELLEKGLAPSTDLLPAARLLRRPQPSD